MLSSASSVDAIRVSGRWATSRPAPARRSCIVLAAVAVIIAFLLLAVPLSVSAQTSALKGEASLSVADGYARLLLKFPESVDTEVRTSGNILVISFKRPVDIAIDRILVGAADWVGAARRDPDGRALRIALARKLRINRIDAGEQVFIDLLPQTWTAAPPGPPPEVVAELARRARAAERMARDQAQLAQLKQDPPVRVRVANQPTFVRYIFDLSELVGVSTERGRDRLTLSVAKPLRFDLSEARLGSSPPVSQIDAVAQPQATQVTFSFSGPVDVRTFREDTSYIVDVLPIGGKPAQAAPKPAAQVTPPSGMRLAGIDAPETVPAPSSSEPPRAAVSAPTGPSPAVAPAMVEKPAPPPARAVAAAPRVAEPAAASPSSAPPAPSPSAADEAPLPPDVTPSAPAVAVSPKPAPPLAAAAAPPPAVPPREAQPVRRAGAPDSQIVATLQTAGDTLTLDFPFRDATPAAVFMRGDILWLVFDSSHAVDVSALTNDPGGAVRSAVSAREGDAQVVRVRLDRPRMVSLATRNQGWMVALADSGLEASKPISVTRLPQGPLRTGASIAFDSPKKIHWLRDPDLGDTLLVVTGLGPARGFAKTGTYLEFAALMSTHGIVLQRLADDLTAEIVPDHVRVARPSGLTLSGFVQSGRRGEARGQAFDTQLWGFDRQADFGKRQGELATAAADAPSERRTAPRLDLARFYLSRDLHPEAKAVLDMAITEDRPTPDNPSPYILRAVANIMLGRNDEALKDLSNPLVATQDDTQLWRAMALARQGKWPEAREAFRRGEMAMSILPVELQRLALRDNMRSAIEVGDFATGSIKLEEFESIGVPRELQPSIAVLTGRLNEGLGRKTEALTSYKLASESWERPSAAQGRLREIALRYGMGNLNKPEAIGDLETLITTWRGDETEVEALQILSRLYTEEGRYRDAFHVMRTALTAHPNSDLTRRIQDAAVITFDSLFLAGKGDTLPAIEAMALFYDFRELMPIGRRGDEMIRRLADRLVAVDLLDQAADLLQHQVDNRLQGSARAQVATRLAAIYLMARKPDRAQAALRTTRTSTLTPTMRKQRLLLEARAMADIGRHDAALEAVDTVEGAEAVRLRGDILWAARRWREAAEQIELLHGERWKDFAPLSDIERADVLRAAVGYALAEDSIGIARLREKYEARMADTPDQRLFSIVIEGLGSDSAEFREVARVIAKADTLEAFLRDMRMGYPETATSPAGSDAPHAALMSRGDVTASIPLPRPRQAATPRVQVR